MATAVPKSISLSEPLKITFLGGGQMGTALSKGLATAGVLAEGSSIVISDPFIAKSGGKHPLAAEFPSLVSSSADNAAAIADAHVVVLAVKPQVLAGVLRPLSAAWSGHELVVSIAAGVTLAALRSLLPSGQRLIRMMPNTPALVGAMAGGFVLGTAARESDASLLLSLFGALGVLKRVESDALLDAVSAVAGCSPAFAFIFCEALADGGVKCGLPRADAIELAATALMGAAKMVLETGRHSAALKDAVCSPAGATIEGVHALERGGFRAAVIDAVEAAADKCALLGKPKSPL